MKVHEYNEMMAYMLRPRQKFANGGRIGFGPGGQAFREKKIQESIKEFGLEALDEGAKKLGYNNYRETVGTSDGNKIKIHLRKYGLVVSKDEAMSYFIDLVMDKETFPAIMDVLAQGVPVMEIVQLMLMQGFKEGVINPDLMLLLAEPFAYLLLGLAERQGIRAKIVDDSDEPYDPDDPDNLDEEEEFANGNLFKSKLQTITKPQDDEELNLEERLPSLMARGE